MNDKVAATDHYILQNNIFCYSLKSDVPKITGNMTQILKRKDYFKRMSVIV